MFKTINDPNAVQAQVEGTWVYGLNDNGEVVGLYNTNSGAAAFFEINGVFTTLPDPSPGLTSNVVAYGVNNAGQIVGEYDLLAGGHHGFLYSGGTYTTIEDPNSAGFGATSCEGINDLGQIVGSYAAGNGVAHGFLYSGGANGTYTNIDVPWAQQTWAHGINNAGEIVGYYTDSNNAFHGFTYINGTYATFDDAQGTQGTWIFGINDLGQIVGKYNNATGQHGFLYSGGVFLTADDPNSADPNGFVVSEVYDINNAGRMAGFYFDDSSVVHGFVTTPQPAINDFSADGNSDALWRSSNGALIEWHMNGTSIAGSGYVTYQGNQVSPDASWSVVGTSDFNGEGHADMLWRKSDGTLAMWLMNGSAIASSSGVTSQGIAIAPDQSWNVAATGDFSGDGKADILWRQNGGSLVLWSMNGSTIASSDSLTFRGKPVSPDASWSVAGTGDFDGNGKTDILWRQSAGGALAIWSMNDSSVTSSASVLYQGNKVMPDASWSVAGIGDFNGDGFADVLWRNSNNSLSLWQMAGSSVSSTGAITYQGNVATPDASWKLVEIGDFNGDGNCDVLWRNDNGTMAEWLMKGSQIIASQAPSAQGSAISPDGSWSVQARPTNFG